MSQQSVGPPPSYAPTVPQGAEPIDPVSVHDFYKSYPQYGPAQPKEHTVGTEHGAPTEPTFAAQFLNAPELHPERQSYTLANDASLQHGSLGAVLSSRVRPNDYDPLLAHYLAYTCSLLGDELTNPLHTVKTRLQWAEAAEFHPMEGPLRMECLTVRTQGFVVLSFRSRLTWRETLDAVGNMKSTLEPNVPLRFAITDQHRRDNKKNPQNPVPLPFGLSANPRWEEEDVFMNAPKSGSVSTTLTIPYQAIAGAIRSFVVDTAGQPIPLVDSVYYNVENRNLEHRGTSRFDRTRPLILVTGMGLGGAMAQLCAMDMCALYGPTAVACYSFGAPRLGNNKFSKLWRAYCGDLFRVCNSTDPLVDMPGQLSGFFHPKNTRVLYEYPPLLGQAGYMGGHIVHPTTLTRPVHKISRTAQKVRHSENDDLRIHTNYVGVQFAQRLDAIEPFNFVVRRASDVEPVQPTPAEGEAPNRAELDISATHPPWELFLRNLDPEGQPAMKRRLQAYNGTRQTPYIRTFTPAVPPQDPVLDEGDVRMPGTHATGEASFTKHQPMVQGQEQPATGIGAH